MISIVSISVIIQSSIPKLNFKIVYRERLGDPFNGVTVTDLWLTTETDTLYCQQLQFMINSLNPLDFNLNASDFYVSISRSGTGRKSFWFLPVRLTGKVKLNDGMIRIRNNLVKNVNANITIDGLGPILSVDANSLFCEYQDRKFFANGEILMNPGMFEVRNFQVLTEGGRIQLNGSYLSDRAKFDIAGKINLDQFIGVKGDIAFEGKLEYEKGKLTSDLNGQAIDFFNIKVFPVMVNVLNDTIKVICPKIEYDTGFANLQALFIKTKLTKADVEFDHFPVKIFFPQLNLPIDGQLTYKNGKLAGKLSSYSTGFDSIIVAKEGDNFDFRGFSQDGFCEITGEKDSLLIGFARFPITSLCQVLGLKGEGIITGVIKKESDKFSGEFEANDLLFGPVKSSFLKCVFPSFMYPGMNGSAKVEGYGLEVGGIDVGDFIVDYNDKDFTLHSGDSINLHASWNGAVFTVDHFYTKTDKFSVTSLNPFSIRIRKDIIIEDLNLYFNEGLIRGKMTIGKHMDFDFRIDRLNISYFDPELKGKLSVMARKDKINFEVDSLSYEGSQFGDLHGSFVFKPNNIKIKGDAQNIKFAGSLLPEPKVEFSFEDFPLSACWFLNKYLQTDRCKLNGVIIVAKSCSGDIEANGDQLLVKATSSKIANFVGKINIKGNRIVFSSLEGNTEHGSLKASGWFDLKRFKVDTFHLTIKYDRGYISLPDVHGYTDGQLSIDAGKRVFVRGNIDVIEGVYSYSLAGIEGGVKRYDDKLDLDLKIEAPQGIMLKGDLINSSLEGELRLREERGVYSLSGEFVSNRGDIRYLDHYLKLEYANVTFINDPEINPLLDLMASMPTRMGYRIILRVTGRLREPIFTFSSDPDGLSEQDIITYLNTGFTWTELQEMGSEDKISSLVSERMIRLLTYSLSRELKGMSGMDYLDIEKSQLTIGKYLKPNLFFSYTHRLGQFSDDAFEIDYTLRPKERIVIEKLQEGEYSVQYKLRIKF